MFPITYFSNSSAILGQPHLTQQLLHLSRLDNYQRKNEESISEGDHETNIIQKKANLFDLLKLRRSNSQKEVCSVCLEEFKGRRSVMNLPCCHRYHSDCLLTWLASNSHCYYCRTHVQTWLLLLIRLYYAMFHFKCIILILLCSYWVRFIIYMLENNMNCLVKYYTWCFFLVCICKHVMLHFPPFLGIIRINV